MTSPEAANAVQAAATFLTEELERVRAERDAAWAWQNDVVEALGVPPEGVKYELHMLKEIQRDYRKVCSIGQQYLHAFTEPGESVFNGIPRLITKLTQARYEMDAFAAEIGVSRGEGENERRPTGPELAAMWRAHVEEITSLRDETQSLQQMLEALRVPRQDGLPF